MGCWFTPAIFIFECSQRQPESGCYNTGDREAQTDWILWYPAGLLTRSGYMFNFDRRYTNDYGFTIAISSMLDSWSTPYLTFSNYGSEKALVIGFLCFYFEAIYEAGEDSRQCQ